MPAIIPALGRGFVAKRRRIGQPGGICISLDRYAGRNKNVVILLAQTNIIRYITDACYIASSVHKKAIQEVLHSVLRSNTFNQVFITVSCRCSLLSVYPLCWTAAATISAAITRPQTTAAVSTVKLYASRQVASIVGHGMILIVSCEGMLAVQVLDLLLLL